MKLATLKEGGRDGTLIVVSKDLTRAVKASRIAPTLLAAIENWPGYAPQLHRLRLLQRFPSLSGRLH